MTVAETLAVALERWITQRSVVAAALRLPTVFDDEERTTVRVDELVELMNLGDYRNSFVRELSTGTRRIVDLACLVAHRPTVVLLDEPSSGIAQREVEALAPVLLRLRDEMGASLLVIEHDMPLISSIGDRLIALDQGEVIAIGAPADVLTHPDVVESYLGNNEAARQRSGPGGSHMQPASSTGAERSRQLRRWGPIGAVVLIAAVVGIVVATRDSAATRARQRRLQPGRARLPPPPPPSRRRVRQRRAATPFRRPAQR